jgi:hypothetical protein
MTPIFTMSAGLKIFGMALAPDSPLTLADRLEPFVQGVHGDEGDKANGDEVGQVDANFAHDFYLGWLWVFPWLQK